MADQGNAEAKSVSVIFRGDEVGTIALPVRGGPETVLLGVELDDSRRADVFRIGPNRYLIHDAEDVRFGFPCAEMMTAAQLRDWLKSIGFIDLPLEVEWDLRGVAFEPTAKPSRQKPRDTEHRTLWELGQRITPPLDALLSAVGELFDDDYGEFLRETESQCEKIGAATLSLVELVPPELSSDESWLVERAPLADRFVSVVSAVAGFAENLLIDVDLSRATGARYWRGAFKRLAALQDSLAKAIRELESVRELRNELYANARRRMQERLQATFDTTPLTTDRKANDASPAEQAERSKSLVRFQFKPGTTPEEAAEDMQELLDEHFPQYQTGTNRTAPPATKGKPPEWEDITDTPDAADLQIIGGRRALTASEQATAVEALASGAATVQAAAVEAVELTARQTSLMLAGRVPVAPATVDELAAAFAPSQLAERFGLKLTTLNKALQRWRAKHGDGWHEVENRKPREPKYLYRLSAVMPLINELLAASSEVGASSELSA